MIYYPIQTLINNGIRDIIIVTGRDHMGDVIGLLGSGKQFEADFTYKVQDEPGGIAQALSICQDVIYADSVAVILGDNIFLPAPRVPRAKSGIWPYRGAHLYLKWVKDASRFGIATVKSDEIIDIQEKPYLDKGYAITGLYIYGKEVWDYLEDLEPSSRGELEISDVNRRYMQEGSLTYSVLTKDTFWSDAGTFESMRATQEYLWSISSH